MLQTLPNTKSQLVVVINTVVEVYNLDIVMGTISKLYQKHLADYIKNSPFIVSLTHDNDGNILLTIYCAVLELSPVIFYEGGNQELNNSVLTVSDRGLEKKTVEL